MKDLYNLFRSNLKSIRNDRDYSQEELSVSCHYDRTYIGKIERGAVQPSLEALFRLADTLDVRIADFFAKYDESGTPDSLQYPRFSYHTDDFNGPQESDGETETDRFSIIFEGAHHPIVLLDETGVVLEANPSMADLIGRSPDNLKNQPLWKADFWEADETSSVKEAVRESLAGNFVERDLTLRTPVDRERLQFTFSPVSEGEATDYVVVEASTPS